VTSSVIGMPFLGVAKCLWGAQIQFRHAVQDWVKSANFAHALRGWVRLTSTPQI